MSKETLKLLDLINETSQTKDIEQLRKAFLVISESLIDLIAKYEL